MFAQAGGEFAQQAMNFAQLFFVQVDQLIVEIDGFNGLNEESAAAATGAVDDAFDTALASGDDGNNETVVADGDKILLHIVVMGAQEAFEGFLDQMALLLALAAQAGEGDAGMVG